MRIWNEVEPIVERTKSIFHWHAFQMKIQLCPFNEEVKFTQHSNDQIKLTFQNKFESTKLGVFIWTYFNSKNGNWNNQLWRTKPKLWFKINQLFGLNISPSQCKFPINEHFLRSFRAETSPILPSPLFWGCVLLAVWSRTDYWKHCQFITKLISWTKSKRI